MIVKKRKGRRLARPVRAGLDGMADAVRLTSVMARPDLLRSPRVESALSLLRRARREVADSMREAADHPEIAGRLT